MAFLGPSLRRRRVSDRPGVRAGWALLLSLLLNAGGLWLIVRAGAFGLNGPIEPARPVALAPLTAEQWEANRAVSGEAARAPVRPPAVAAAPPPPRTAAPPTPPPPPAVEEERPRGQVVDVAPSGEARRPAESRFLAERDSTVERETRSRHAGRVKHENTLAEPSAGPQAQLPAQGEGGAAEESRPGEETADAPAGTGADRLVLPDQPQEERLALAPRAPGDGPGGVTVAPRPERPRIPGSGERLELPGPPDHAEAGARKAGRLDPRLRPDLRSMERIAGGPGVDALDGVEEGEGTALNTRSYKYATYINRVASGIYGQWKPGRAMDSRDPERRMFPNRDWTTVVMVNLDASGQLVSVGILERSGLEFLDEEVVRAVRAAAPFPNPPTGLVDADGRVRLAMGWRLLAARPGGVQFVAPRLVPGMQRPYPE